MQRDRNVDLPHPLHRVAVHADDFEERLLVLPIPGERPYRLGHPRAGEISLPAHHRRDRRRQVASLVAVVRHTHRHQQRAQIGVAETQRAEAVRISADLLGRVAGVIDDDLLRQDQRVDRVPEGLDVELAVRADELHQVERRQVAGRIVQKHILRARVGGVDARRVLAGVPAVDGGIELHAGIAALVGGLGNPTQQVARLVAILGLAAEHVLGPPLAILLRRAHEIVGGAHGVVGVLEKDRAVGFAVERSVVSSLHQRVGLLLFLGLAPDEFFDVRMVGVEDHHLGGAPRLAAGFDDAGESVETLHKGERPAGAPAARKHRVFLAQGRKVGSRARAPLEQHAFGLGQVQNRFQRILDGNDEAGRALRPPRAAFELLDAVGRGVVDPAVAARFFHAHVEPNRRIEAGLLREHQVGQLGAEVLAILVAAEIPVLLAPAGDGVDHPLHQLGHAGFALRRPQLAMEVLAGDDVGGRLRPIGRHHDVALLEDHRAFVVADRGGAGFPAYLVIRSLAGRKPGGKIAGKRYPGIAWLGGLNLQRFYFRTQTYGKLSHCHLLLGSPR